MTTSKGEIDHLFDRGFISFEGSGRLGSSPRRLIVLRSNGWASIPKPLSTSAASAVVKSTSWIFTGPPCCFNRSDSLGFIFEELLMSVAAGNILADIQHNLSDEQVLELLSAKHVRIERIVSAGQRSPAGYWYDQDRAEWVLVLQGAAKVLFEGEAEPRLLGRGDFLNIPPHVRHRVEWTDSEQATVWLAIHYQSDDKGAHPA
jgi:cupin 2 domain-containing protein